MNILVIDAQGGGIGKQIVSALKKRYPEQYITAVGTNSLATSAMLKAGADVAATGENPVIVCSRKADVIVGPVGIVIADALLGEITAAMATAENPGSDPGGIFPGKRKAGKKTFPHGFIYLHG